MLSCLAMVLGIASAQACGPENGKETPADTRELSVSPVTAQVGHEAAECSFTVETNFEYKVVIDVDWIAVKSASPTGLVLNINENTSVTPREADVRLVDRNDRYWFKTVKVVQDKNPVRKVRLSIVDKNATAQTKALYANLWIWPGKVSCSGITMTCGTDVTGTTSLAVRTRKPCAETIRRCSAWTLRQ